MLCVVVTTLAKTLYLKIPDSLLQLIRQQVAVHGLLLKEMLYLCGSQSAIARCVHLIKHELVLGQSHCQHTAIIVLQSGSVCVKSMNICFQDMQQALGVLLRVVHQQHD